MYGKGLFCHTCQTNQMLLSNLLSNYLPPPADPEYNQRLAVLPEYRESIETRYPPVCANCLPAVEEEIRRRDHVARTSALGGFLKESKGQARQRKISANQSKEKLDRSLVIWRVRGILWFTTLIAMNAFYVANVVGYDALQLPSSLLVAFPVFIFVSIFWTAWDPTYAVVKRDQLQGRAVRQRGKTLYNLLQFLAWLSRLSAAMTLVLVRYRSDLDFVAELINKRPGPYAIVSLLFEGAVLAVSIYFLGVQRAPQVRLLESSSQLPSRMSVPPSAPTSRSGTPVASEPDVFASLTLSNKPVVSGLSSNPIFGLPSLSQANPAPALGQENGDAMDADVNDAEEEEEEERDPNAMDWTPATPARAKGKQRANGVMNDDGSWLRPQRFFAPEEPTGLENLFARTIKLADNDDGAKGQRRGMGKGRSRKIPGVWMRIGICAVLLIPLIAVSWKVWGRSRRSATMHVDST